MRNSTLILLFFIISCISFNAEARQKSTEYSADKRIRTYSYDPNEVYVYVGHYLFQSSIEFEPKETIVNIAMGNSLGWQVTSPGGSRIFLKPIAKDAATNMTVITNRRTYLFELYAETAEEGMQDADMTFVSRFIYPDSEEKSGSLRQYAGSNLPNIERNPEKYNFNYTITGSRLVSPLKVFDDGVFTYLQFRDKNADVPAIFLVGKMGHESLINFRVEGPYIVIEQVGQQFTLRYGDEVACLFNESNPLKRIPEPRVVKFLGIF
jgi:type IV secretion system protein VirB9